MPSKQRQRQFFAANVTFEEDVDIDGTLTATGFTASVATVANGADADLPVKTGVVAATQLAAVHVASAVNYVGLKGSTATTAVEVQALGTATNLDLKLKPKGTGEVDMDGASKNHTDVKTGADSDLSFYTGVAAVVQAIVKHVAGTIVNALTFKGSITTAPVELGAEGTDSNIDIKLSPKGTGSVTHAQSIKRVPTAITTTVDGLTTGLVAKGTAYILVTSSSADNVFRPPVGVVNDVIEGYVGANGCEIRTLAAGTAKINDVACNGDATNEAALPALTSFRLECHVAEEWVLIAFDKLSAAVVIVPDGV